MGCASSSPKKTEPAPVSSPAPPAITSEPQSAPSKPTECPPTKFQECTVRPTEQATAPTSVPVPVEEDDDGTVPADQLDLPEVEKPATRTIKPEVEDPTLFGGTKLPTTTEVARRQSQNSLPPLDVDTSKAEMPSTLKQPIDPPPGLLELMNALYTHAEKQLPEEDKDDGLDLYQFWALFKQQVVGLTEGEEALMLKHAEECGMCPDECVESIQDMFFMAATKPDIEHATDWGEIRPLSEDGKVVYFNKRTGLTTWQPPEEEVATAA